MVFTKSFISGNSRPVSENHNINLQSNNLQTCAANHAKTVLSFPPENDT